MDAVAAIFAALLGFLGLVLGYGKVQQKRGRSEEQNRFRELVAEQEKANAERAADVASAPGRSAMERADLVRRLAEAQRKRRAKLSGPFSRVE